MAGSSHGRRRPTEERERKKRDKERKERDIKREIQAEREDWPTGGWPGGRRRLWLSWPEPGRRRERREKKEKEKRKKKRIIRRREGRGSRRGR